MPCLQARFQLGVRGPVPVVVNAGAESLSRFHQSDLESRGGQSICSDAASRTTPYDTDIKNPLLHLWRLLAWKIDLFKQEQPRLSGRYQIDITVAIDIHEQYQFVVEAGSMMCSFHRTLVYSPSCRRGFLESMASNSGSPTCSWKKAATKNAAANWRGATRSPPCGASPVTTASPKASIRKWKSCNARPTASETSKTTGCELR